MKEFILSLLINHPVLFVCMVLSFVLTVLVYLAPDFTSDNLIISSEVNIGTFCGTFVHCDWSHWIGNMLLLIPVWSYADNLAGKPFVAIIVFTNMILTGVFGFVSGMRLCGLSGVVYMLVGLTAIIGNWLMFGFAIALFISEIGLLGKQDRISHVAHIIFFVIGIGIGLARCVKGIFC